MEHIAQIQSLTAQQQSIFYNEFNNHKKSFGIAFCLCFFLGSFGAHKFYLDQAGKGVLYLLFCWTCIPGILAFINLFTMSGQIKKINQNIAADIINKLN